MNFKKTLLSTSLIFAAASSQAAQLDVTITNLTHGIHFTPFVVAGHDANTHIFQVGEAATDELQAQAEGGDISGLVTQERRLSKIQQVDYWLPAPKPTSPLIPVAWNTFHSVQCYFQPMMALQASMPGRSHQKRASTGST